MIRKTILALSVALTVLGAEGQTKPAAVPAKKAASKLASPAPVGELKEAGPATPPLPPPFSPVFFKEDIKVLDYLANDPKKVYDWVQEQLTTVPGKPDQFSTSDDRKKYETAVQQRMAGLGAFPVVGNCTKKYNADNQSYEVRRFLSGIDDPSLIAVNAEALRLRRLTALKAVVSTEQYTAQNAYGASIEVAKETSEEYVLSFPVGNEPRSILVPGSGAMSSSTPYKSLFNYLQMTMNMPASDARDADKQIGCLFVLSLRAPYAFKFNERDTPTRAVPFESVVRGFSLYGNLDRMVVFNKVTGAVYAQADR